MEAVNKVYSNSNPRDYPDNKSSNESIKNASSNSLFQVRMFRMKNAKKVIIGNLNINLFPNKFKQLKELVFKYVDIV